MTEDIQDSGVDQSTESTSTAVSAEDLVKSALKDWKSAQNQEEPAKKAAPEKPKSSKASDDDEFVEITDPAVQKRVNNLYKQVKSLEETQKILKKEYQKQAEANEMLLKRAEEADKQKASEKEDREVTLLRNRIRQARELGNEDEVDKLTEALIDLKTEQKLTRAQEKALADAKARHQEAELQSQQSPNFNKSDVDLLAKLGSEQNDDGELIRPWLTKGDEDFERAMRLGASITNAMYLEGEELSLSKVMEELDTIMFARRGTSAPAASKAKSAPAVLSSRGTVAPPKQNSTKLNRDEKYAAQKLGISEERYARNKAIAERATHVSIEDL